jgi:predicted GNAT family N-acyltransferase
MQWRGPIRRHDYNFAVPSQPLPAGTSLVTGTWAELKPAARAVRHAVFVVEQNIPVALEWDEWDDLSLHAVVFDAAREPVGTARLLPASFDRDSPHTGHIGRMAVLEHVRRAGIGGALLQALMAAAPAQGFSEIVLHAQSYVAPFYARHGYVIEGDEFIEAGIAHRTMRVVLRPDSRAARA